MIGELLTTVDENLAVNLLATCTCVLSTQTTKYLRESSIGKNVMWPIYVTFGLPKVERELSKVDSYRSIQQSWYLLNNNSWIILER